MYSQTANQLVRAPRSAVYSALLEVDNLIHFGWA